MRRHSFVLLCALLLAAVAATSAAAHSTPKIRAEQAHARVVRAEVARIGINLEGVIQQFDGARVELQQVRTSLRRNTAKLHVATKNFHAAQARLMSRLYSLYVYGKPTTLDVLAGSKSLSALISRAEAAQALSNQDSALGREALHFERVVKQRQNELTVLKQKRVATVQRLASRKQEITSAIQRQKRLLASIHSSIHTLQVQEAKHEAALRAAALARIKAAAQARANQSSGGPVQFPIPILVGTGAGHSQAAVIALRYLGIPYVWGGATPSVGFDCSGLVMYVYAQLGISLPHFAAAQYAETEPISTSQMQPGDLVFFVGSDGTRTAPGHVGIYIGGGQFVDAPYTGSVVRIDNLAAWAGSFIGARRVP